MTPRYRLGMAKIAMASVAMACSALPAGCSTPTAVEGPVDLVLGVPVAVADGMLTLVAVTPARSAGRSARNPATPSRFAFAFQGGY